MDLPSHHEQGRVSAAGRAGNVGARAVLPVALVLVLALAALTAPPAASAAAPFGYNDNAPLWGQSTPERNAQLARAGGAQLHRIAFDWRSAEREPGRWKLDLYDEVYRADLAAGIRPILQLMFAPPWTWASRVRCDSKVRDCRYPPARKHLRAWRRAAKVLARRYPQAAAIEVWNEPNLPEFWHGGPNPRHYARLVKHAHRAVRATGSGVPVIGGALANGGREAIPYEDFLREMYRKRVRGRMDGISVHPYPGDIDLWAFFRTLTEVREIRDAAGDDVPIWITEIGISTAGSRRNHAFGQRDQAAALAELVSLARAMPDVQGVIVHTLLEPSLYRLGTSEREFGVLYADGTPKPAYCALARVVGASYECPALVAAPALPAGQAARWEAQRLLQRAADAARAHRRATGSYEGLTPQRLQELDPALKGDIAPDRFGAPGPSSDPARVIVVDAARSRVVLCNASRADRSYCVRSSHGAWRYGSSTGSMDDTAAALERGSTWWW